MFFNHFADRFINKLRRNYLNIIDKYLFKLDYVYHILTDIYVYDRIFNLDW